MIARQCGGVVIPRYAPSSMRLPSVPAELRPDRKVRTGSHWHYHGAEAAKEPLTIPTSGKRLPTRFIHTPETAARHIAKVHGGINTDELHLDEHRGEVRLPSRRRGEANRRSPPSLAQARRGRSRLLRDRGLHQGRCRGLSRRSCIQRPIGALRRAPELEDFVPLMQGSIVYIVPDSDWYDNGAVLAQAMFCRTFLREDRKKPHMLPPLPQARMETKWGSTII